jgi:two-component system cell cycle sensor histidine kinase/response regulator CckA
MKSELERLRRKVMELEGFKTRRELLKQSPGQCTEPFYKIFCAAANPMAITSLKEGRVVGINEAYCQITGYKREELIGHTTLELGIWADPQQREKVINTLKKDGRVLNVEVGVRRKDKGIHAALFSVDKINLNGELYLLSIATDITKLKNAERELKESEQKYRMLVEKSLQGLAVMQDESFVFCNSRFAEITGYSVEELLSLSSAQMIEMIHPDDRKLINDRRRDRLNGKPVLPQYEYRGIKKDGTEIWLEIYSSVIEYDGKPAIQSAFRDITERKKALEGLQKALDWQKAIFEGSRDGFIISDKNSNFIDANERACKLLGYSKEELLKMGARDLNKSVDPSVLETIRKRILKGEEYVGETQVYTKDGRKVDVEFGHRRVIIAGKIYIHSIIRDITKQKRLEAQLVQSQKMEAIGVLAGGVSHDFNNILTIIKGYAELMLEDVDPNDAKRQDLEQIGIATQRAESLISQLLAFSRKQIIQPTILNLNDVLNETNKMLRRLIGEDIEVACITKSDLGLVNADHGQLQQIIMNLAVNARDAMRKGGRLTIETANADFDEEYVSAYPSAKPGRYIMLAISDNGIGMDAATQARIFDPFFTTKAKGEGTGLGLSTVYGIVKQNNGFIGVYSEPGKGTSFKIYLPRVEGTVSPPETVSDLDVGFRGSKTVLIVEDEAPVRALACRILRDHGYKILEAANGLEAQGIAKEYEGDIHLVLSDVIMPAMGGEDLISWIKTIRPDVKALYVSGYTNNSIIHHGILDPNVAFLQKPYSVNSLARKVREVIDS